MSTEDPLKQYAEWAFKEAREQAKRDLKREQARPGDLHRQLQSIAKNARWNLIRIAIDHRLERGETDRKLPDLRALFADNAPVIADAWKLHEGDPRRQQLINAINREGVTKDTEGTASHYLNARLQGQKPDEARHAVEEWSLFRP